MCNLYSHPERRGDAQAVCGIRRRWVNLPPQPGIFPDYQAPIIHNEPSGPRLAMTRWGMPSSMQAIIQAATRRAGKLKAKGKAVDFKELLKVEPDSGTTNVRNTSSAHWKRWLGVESRCLVPFTSFSEFDHGSKQDVWFAFGAERPTAFFAGIWAPQSVRKINTGMS